MHKLSVGGDGQFLLTHIYKLCVHRRSFGLAYGKNPEISPEKIVRLQFQSYNVEDSLVITWLIAEAMQYAWARRQNNQNLSLDNLKVDLRIKAEYMAVSSKFSGPGKKLIRLINGDQLGD